MGDAGKVTAELPIDAFEQVEENVDAPQSVGGRLKEAIQPPPLHPCVQRLYRCRRYIAKR